ncbi:MAG: glycosyltransferase family 4 protein [bacterium]|nr:glycosyltransferase family 4 protein [bacterium]
MMKCNILYVIENASFGGGERAFAQIINGLDKEKYEVYVACLPRSSGPASELFVEKIEDAAQIIPFDLRNQFNLRNIFNLTRIIKQKKIDLVHSQGARADFFSRIAARLVKMPVVVSTMAAPVGEYNVNPIKKAVYVVLDRFSERFVDRFIVVAEHLGRKLIQIHKISSHKVVKIYNGVEIEPDAGCRMSDVRKKIMQELMIPEDVMLIGTIGRLVWEKGLPYFIQAIKEIDARCKMQDVRYLIVGEGELKESLKFKVKSLKLEGRVIFTGFRQDIKEILGALDILVLPSIREGQPMITLETMAMGKPIVATDIEGVNETVVNGITGILVPPKNSRALAEAIVCLLKDKKKAREMGQAGRRVVEEKFNLKDKIEQHKRLYETIIVEKLGVC